MSREIENYEPKDKGWGVGRFPFAKPPPPPVEDDDVPTPPADEDNASE